MDILLNTTMYDSGYMNFTVSEASNFDDDNTSNETEYVFDLGPRRDSLYFVIPITVIYVLIFISGVFGNVCTCVVISRNRYMRTTTNYYLFSLALSDLFFLVMGLPQELYQLWNKYPYIFGEAFCILRGFTSEMSTNTSILTITCFTVERYIAICHPIKAHTMSKLSRAVKLICGVWILGGICAVPLAIQFGVVIKEFQGHLIPETAACTMKSPLKNSFEISTICFFFLPMVIISVLYMLIALELRKSEPSGRPDAQKESIVNGDNKNSLQKKCLFKRVVKKQSNKSTRSIGSSNANSRKSVIKMLFAVVVAFFLCWAPFHAQRLMAVTVREHTPTAIMVYTILTHISGITYYVSATINPILYNIMSKKFREAFKVTLVMCCRKNSPYDNTSSSYTSVLRASMYRNPLLRNSKHNNGSIQYRDIESDNTKTETTLLSSSTTDCFTRNKKDLKMKKTELDVL